MTIDTHFHYPSMKEKTPEATLPDDLIGMEIGIDGGDLEKRIKATGPDKRIFFSVGAGPWVLKRDDFISIDDEISKLESDISKFGADAIGECGMDLYRGYATNELQEELFLKHIKLAGKYSLPLIIHSRDADSYLEKFASQGLFTQKTVMHCFSSGVDTAKLMLDAGCYISFAGNVTYKANKHIQESAKYVPIDRILVETDSPYLTPVPKRHEFNNPINTELTLDYLSELRGVNKEELKENIVNNFITLMGGSESKVKRDIALF